jgi:hypothetical protein
VDVSVSRRNCVMLVSGPLVFQKKRTSHRYIYRGGGGQAVRKGGGGRGAREEGGKGGREEEDEEEEGESVPPAQSQIEAT